MSKILSVAWIAFACCALCLRAENAPIEWHVYSDVRDGRTGNQQLTNAFIQAKSGDTITIHAGTYNLATEEMIFRYEYTNSAHEVVVDDTQGTCLFSSVDNLTVQGDPLANREDIVLSGLGGASETAEDGQHQIMRLEGASCTVKHLTFYKGIAAFDKTMFRDNQLITTDKWAYRRGGGLYFKKSSSICRDCVFERCYASHGGAAALGTYYDCLFIRNSGRASQYAGALYGASGAYTCRFEENKRGALRSSSGVVSNCFFIANLHNGGNGIFFDQQGSIVDCVFTNNSINSVLEGSKTVSEIARCKFYGQHMITNLANRISSCSFVRTDATSFGILANCQRVEDCRFISLLGSSTTSIEVSDGKNASIVSNCVLSRCELSGFNVRRGWVFFDVPSADNCLIEDNNIWGYDKAGVFGYSDGRASSIVNCTIVSNKCNNGFYNEGQGVVTFRNTLFFNNKVGGRSWRKFDIEYKSGYGHDTVRMVNSIYKSDKTFDGTASLNKYNDWNFSPMFMKDRYPNKILEHPYALCHLSPCIGFGTNDGLSENDIDLARKKRLNGIVDVGCYENWHVSPGLKVVVR